MGEYNCPHCKNPIYDDEALLCHFCGESLQRSGRGALGKMKYGRPKIIMVILTIAVLLALIIWLTR